ncbi:hypothetical protein C2845_PM12G02760 [Panicum miliaceum]|uniref:Uncharacterized protein n=1 Tax=Panicum miliaceum TaxID=4540 RepID=A0A3L6QHX2_PANMI|nr:hypothetical protein C2845_PM12G02760 [Panicum miliaceum]
MFFWFVCWFGCLLTNKSSVVSIYTKSILFLLFSLMGFPSSQYTQEFPMPCVLHKHLPFVSKMQYTDSISQQKLKRKVHGDRSSTAENLADPTPVRSRSGVCHQASWTLTLLPQQPPAFAAGAGAAAPEWRSKNSRFSFQTSPSSYTSFFQMGTDALSSSITYRHASMASARCVADAATNTLASPAGTGPRRCATASRRSACRDRASRRMPARRRRAIAAYASYRSSTTRRPAKWSRVVPSNVAMAPADRSRTWSTYRTMSSRPDTSSTISIRSSSASSSFAAAAAVASSAGGRSPAAMGKQGFLDSLTWQSTDRSCPGRGREQIRFRQWGLGGRGGTAAAMTSLPSRCLRVQ